MAGRRRRAAVGQIGRAGRRPLMLRLRALGAGFKVAGVSVPCSRPFWDSAPCPGCLCPAYSCFQSPLSRSEREPLSPSSGSLLLARSHATMAAQSMAKRMVWVDLEMTGLDIEKDKIIEMACIITDADLNILAEGPHLIVNQPNELLDGMSEWCTEHHGKSGLTQAVRDSKISLQQAEYEFLSFVRQHTPPGLCPLAGNSVHADKKFLDKYMPQFMKHLHYRIIDVSTIKELCRRWYPDEYEDAPKKKASHRALNDIRESIKELQFYRTHIFKETKADEKKRKTHLENGDNNQQES